MKSKRLQRIVRENLRFEKETPYNFCDHWCARCIHEKQMRCRLYQDEFEQEITCIAYGREPGDPEITEAVFKQQMESLGKDIGNGMEEYGADFDDLHDSNYSWRPEQSDSLKESFLQRTVAQYMNKARSFLKATFFNDKTMDPGLIYDFETVAWYHTLLPAKLHRALSGIHEPDDPDEFGLCDTVAQLAICKKAINESTKALRKLKNRYSSHHKVIVELLALLDNISSRIQHIEDSI